MKNIRQNKGFTLIELMIVVAVIAVLAAIAYPSFRDAVLKSRRSDAMDAITSIQLAQEKFRANCIEYAQKLGSDNTCDNDTPANNVIKHPTASGNDYYSLPEPGTIEAITDRPFSVAYKITATAKGDQINDSCGNFILEVDSGTVKKYTSKHNEGTYEAKRCWQR